MATPEPDRRVNVIVEGADPHEVKRTIDIIDRALLGAGWTAPRPKLTVVNGGRRGKRRDPGQPTLPGIGLTAGGGPA